MSYPTKPLRMIVPGSTGGPTDIVARMLADRLTIAWGQQVIVDNRIGGNGIIAQQLIARGPTDGHTILVNGVAFAINPSMYKLPYDSKKDFQPVSLVAHSPLMLVVHASVPATTVEALIALAKSKSGQLNYGSFGNGSIVHLGCELFKMTAGIEMTHIVYRGVSMALTDLISGQIQVMLITIPSALQHLNTGRIRGLAVTSRQRSSRVPSMPTMVEAGVPGYELTTWFGVFVPAGTPRAIVIKLQEQVARILDIQDVRVQLDKQGFDVAPANSPEQFSAFLQVETDKFAKIVKAAGIRAD